jgi:hypothetical protein
MTGPGRYAEMCIATRSGRSRLPKAAVRYAQSAQLTSVLRNWFNDPFFRVRAGIASCPVPLGPFENEEQMLKETHYRSERGTRCWLEKKCSKPSSYMYDADIAAAVRSRFEASQKFNDASLWVTAQRRFVWVEGCVSTSRAQRELEQLLAGVPNVERLIVNVSAKRGALPPYRAWGPGQRRGAPIRKRSRKRSAARWRCPASLWRGLPRSRRHRRARGPRSPLAKVALHALVGHKFSRDLRIISGMSLQT